MPNRLSERLISWASILDPQTERQARVTAALPIIDGHVALMPDAHIGKGATIGSVIPTTGAVIPAAVGVDIGCGMIAVETRLEADHLPDSLDGLLARVAAVVPAGMGQGHEHARVGVPPIPDVVDATLTDKQRRTLSTQFGSLGSGNHFVELCLDERDHVWVVLHSGSRGIGNQLATQHIECAKG